MAGRLVGEVIDAAPQLYERGLKLPDVTALMVIAEECREESRRGRVLITRIASAIGVERKAAGRRVENLIRSGVLIRESRGHSAQWGSGARAVGSTYRLPELPAARGTPDSPQQDAPARDTPDRPEQPESPRDIHEGPENPSLLGTPLGVALPVVKRSVAAADASEEPLSPTPESRATADLAVRLGIDPDDAARIVSALLARPRGSPVENLGGFIRRIPDDELLALLPGRSSARAAQPSEPFPDVPGVSATAALAVPCPSCEAAAETPCVDPMTRRPVASTHQARARRAARSLTPTGGTR